MSTLYHYVAVYQYTDKNYIEKTDRTEIIFLRPVVNFEKWEEVEDSIAAAKDIENVRMLNLHFLGAEEVEAKKSTVFDQITESPEKLTEYIARMFELDEHERHGFLMAINVRTVL